MSGLEEEAEGGGEGFNAIDDGNVGTRSEFEFVTKSAQMRVVVLTAKPMAVASRRESAHHTAAQFRFRLWGGASGRRWWHDGSWWTEGFFLGFEGGGVGDGGEKL